MKISLHDGTHVRFVDATQQTHDALVTACWGTNVVDTEQLGNTPSINIVYVTQDQTRRDQYGQQTVHHTSVVHRSKQTAPGMYWYMLQEGVEVSAN
jgi:hypothetical protein